MSKRRLKAIDALGLAIERERETGKFYRQAVETVRSSRWLDWTQGFAPVCIAEFPSPSEALGEFGKGSDDLYALGQAVQSERAAVAFYREVGEITPDVGGKAMFRLLADEGQGT